MSRYLCLLIAVVIVSGVAVPAACAAEQDVSYRVDASRTVLQVQSDGAVLGRVTYVEAGGAAYITRDMRVIPATVGETLLDGDLVSVQPGKFANLKLVDRLDETLLSGGTDGTVVVIEHYSGTADAEECSTVLEDALPDSVKSSWFSIGDIFGDILTTIRELISGESFSVREDTEGAGSRG
ncbi:hypothetical protein FGU65_02750 [Methanoculleus sp. FWC-SCC1]|uniref:DUF5666 domain-containing protein n=1 Tax=Methanoculleus frigidifontis TaxID=2584085 RepID=A0ABT8M7B6_9EURY|nr:hypothetical protein [Methanoculleus sp. FWC-SCC1]MDN7023823.1 hypothetical protein [Methanoculleus sp. FWC-SCC1]